jgi:hypothetical protein
MQRIHPENDLLQTSRRHHPYQHTIGFGQRDATGLHCLSPRADLCRDLHEQHSLELDIESPGRAPQVGDMPAKARNKGDEGGHRFQDGSKTAGIRRLIWHVPVPAIGGARRSGYTGIRDNTKSGRLTLRFCAIRRALSGQSALFTKR